jgi:hypothetical protein
VQDRVRQSHETTTDVALAVAAVFAILLTGCAPDPLRGAAPRPDSAVERVDASVLAYADGRPKRDGATPDGDANARNSSDASQSTGGGDVVSTGDGATSTQEGRALDSTTPASADGTTPAADSGPADGGGCPEGCADGLDCVNGACRCIVDGSCRGCCAGPAVCVQSTTIEQCGADGQACTECERSGSCVGGSCACSDGFGPLHGPCSVGEECVPNGYGYHKCVVL